MAAPSSLDTHSLLTSLRLLKCPLSSSLTSAGKQSGGGGGGVSGEGGGGCGPRPPLHYSANDTSAEDGIDAPLRDNHAGPNYPPRPPPPPVPSSRYGNAPFSTSVKELLFSKLDHINISAA